MQSYEIKHVSSRLCPSFSYITDDPLLLTYFNQYLRESDSENIFRFWLEVSSFLSRRNARSEPTVEDSELISPSLQQLEILRGKMNRMPANDVTAIYFRYISKEAKLPVDIPVQILCSLLC